MFYIRSSDLIHLTAEGLFPFQPVPILYFNLLNMTKFYSI